VLDADRVFYARAPFPDSATLDYLPSVLGPGSREAKSCLQCVGLTVSSPSTAIGGVPIPIPVEMSGRNFRFGSTLDHSMISSARASTDGGIVRPRALAVLRLMIRRTWVTSSTGRSRGV
jgi:hypothetical protein